MEEILEEERIFGQILSERGYIVVASYKYLKIGHIMPHAYHTDNRRVMQPLHVLAETDLADFEAQYYMALALGQTPADLPAFWRPYYYRVSVD